MLFDKKIAVITAYHKEDRAVVERAIDSVKNQMKCEFEVVHYLISDGHPHDFETDRNQVHVVLPSAHGDYGDTPRLIGAMLAIREASYGLLFLDADNVLYEDHLSLSVAKHHDTGANIILSLREMLRKDGSILKRDPRVDLNEKMYDTGSFVFFKEALFDVLEWARIPRSMSVIGDRYFSNLLLKKIQPNIAVLDKATIGYTCLWKDVYIAQGETPPEEAKLLNFENHNSFIHSLSPDELKDLQKRLYLDKNAG